VTSAWAWLRHLWDCYTFTVIVAAIWQAQIWIGFAFYDGTGLEYFSDRLGGHSDDSFGALLAVGFLAELHRRGRARQE
jgi:hypothetical protein